MSNLSSSNCYSYYWRIQGSGLLGAWIEQINFSIAGNDSVSMSRFVRVHLHCKHDENSDYWLMFVYWVRLREKIRSIWDKNSLLSLWMNAQKRNVWCHHDTIRLVKREPLWRCSLTRTLGYLIAFVLGFKQAEELEGMTDPTTTQRESISGWW